MSASKHRRNTAPGRHRRITAEMQRRAELNRRRATLAKCVASVGAVAALSGGVSTAATTTLASSGPGPESATAKLNLPTRTPSRVTASGPASRSTTRATLPGISGGAAGGVGASSTPALIDTRVSPIGDGPVAGRREPGSGRNPRALVTTPVRPKSRSATSVPKVVTPKVGSEGDREGRRRSRRRGDDQDHDENHHDDHHERHDDDQGAGHDDGLGFDHLRLRRRPSRALAARAPGRFWFWLGIRLGRLRRRRDRRPAVPADCPVGRPARPQQHGSARGYGA